MYGRSLASAVVALAILAAPAAGQSASRQSVIFTFSTMEPGRSSGGTFAVEWRAPANPSGKPYSVARVRIELPEGARVDTGAITRCTASDAEIQAQGPSACPPASRLGGGTIVSDTGSSAGFPRFVENDVQNFNGDGEQIGVADARGMPSIPGFSRIVTRTRIQGRASTFDVPRFPGSPPPDNFTAFRSLRLTSRAAGTAVRPYLRTPPACPASGRWISTLSFTYRDGVTQTVRAPTPCRGLASSTCLASRAPVGRGGIGRVRLGASVTRLLSVPAGKARSRGSVVRYCVKGSSGSVRAVIGRRARSELVLSTAARHGNRSLRPGRRTRLPAGVQRIGRRGTVVAVRRGRVRFVGVASRRLLADRGALRRAVARAGF